MRFLSLYKSVEKAYPTSQEEMAKMAKLMEEAMKAGWLLSAEGCMPSATGARVRLTEGKVTVTDGPFTETRELIGGLAIIQAHSKAEAVEFLKEFIAVAGDGECELRQLYHAGD
jgi:hypothetical protein